MVVSDRLADRSGKPDLRAYYSFVVVVDEEVPPGVFTVVLVSVFFSDAAGGLTIVVLVSFLSPPPAGGVTTVVSLSMTLSGPPPAGDSMRCSQATQSDAPIRANTIFFM